MKLLLTSVFGPYGVDDAYGRKENIMELLHNQVTREQGVFSLRFNHQSFGLYFLAENVDVPTVVLDFPSEQRFVAEIKKDYDYVGISFIVPNFAKAQRMASLVRTHAPRSQIILGGHGTTIDDIDNLIEHDHICRGEGVRFLRELFGERVDAPFHHPIMRSAFGKHVMGAPLAADTAVLIPGVGCPNACRFCATSHFFDKRYTSFFDSGAELFEICASIEKETGLTEFFVMDENFLKRPARVRELQALMEKHDKHYRFDIFSSAETITKVGVPFLARLGVTFVWIGVESQFEIYEKNKGIDLAPLIKQLRDHGISVLCSGILFVEQHDRESIWKDIRFVVGLQSDLVQFMGLGPMPGTKLYDDYEQKGRVRHDLPYAEWHGQNQIWFRHPNFTGEETAQLLRTAFRYDFDTQGASILRLCDTQVRGYEGLANYEGGYMARRRELVKKTAQGYRPVLTILRRYAHNAHVRALTQAVIDRYNQVFGPMTLGQRLKAVVARMLAAFESRRVARGRNVYQPKTILTAYRLDARQDSIPLSPQIPLRTQLAA